VHPARKTNNRNNANELFTFMASSYFYVLKPSRRHWEKQ
jgi:hypothetical protein